MRRLPPPRGYPDPNLRLLLLQEEWQLSCSRIARNSVSTLLLLGLHKITFPIHKTEAIRKLLCQVLWSWICSTVGTMKFVDLRTMKLGVHNRIVFVQGYLKIRRKL